MAVASDILPPLDNVVGVTTGAAMASKGDFIRAVIRARRKAVEFMNANPDEAGDIVAKHYNLDKEVARSAVRNLTSSTHPGHSLLGLGQIHLDGHETHGRGAEDGRRDHRRDRPGEDHRHAFPARRHQGRIQVRKSGNRFPWASRESIAMSACGGERAQATSRSAASPRFSAIKPAEVLHALGPIDLDLRKGEFFAVVGPSGCGKSTLLELIAGLAPVTAGTVEFEGRRIAADIPDGIGVVFQEDACFPWLTVEANIAFGLRSPRWRRRRKRAGCATCWC